MDYNEQNYVVTLLVRCQVQVVAHDESEAIKLANQEFGYDENVRTELPTVLSVEQGTL